MLLMGTSPPSLSPRTGATFSCTPRQPLFQNMPVKYLMFINIKLKNNVTIHYDIAKELKTKKQETIARFLKKTIEQNYLKIKSVDMKFNIPALKKDMQSKTSLLMAKTFKI